MIPAVTPATQMDRRWAYAAIGYGIPDGYKTGEATSLMKAGVNSVKPLATPILADTKHRADALRHGDDLRADLVVPTQKDAATQSMSTPFLARFAVFRRLLAPLVPTQGAAEVEHPVSTRTLYTE